MTPLKAESANPLASDTQPIAHYKNAGFLVTYCGLRSFHAFCYSKSSKPPLWSLFMQALHNFTRFKSVDQDKSTRQVLYLSYIFLTKIVSTFHFNNEDYFLLIKGFFSCLFIIAGYCSKVVTFFSVSVTL